jgi:hypothetical protein
MSALSPLPNAFRGIYDNLLRQLDVTLGAFTMYVVEHHWLSVAWGLGESHIPRNDRFEDLRSEETSQIGGYLLGESGSVVVHRQENAFDGERRIDCPAEPHECVE